MLKIYTHRHIDGSISLRGSWVRLIVGRRAYSVGYSLGGRVRAYRVW